jgi:hypothetical protein
LDPFAIEEVRNEYYEQFKNYLNKTSQANANIYDNALGINEVFANLKRHLAQKPYNIKDEMRVKQSLAVLIPKTDFFSDNIFETDKECRSFLSKFGQKQFVDDISWKFKNVRFFNVISKGKDSIGVLQPFEWILKKEMTKKQIRRFFGNLLMTFFITVVVGGLLLGGTLAYNAISNYFTNIPYTSEIVGKTSDSVSEEDATKTSKTENANNYHAAAEKGDADAQYNLGYDYYYGIPKDDKLAVYWFQKAAEQGNANAQTMLGICYEVGSGIKLDYKQAVFWYRKAAEQGTAIAQYNLGRCYDNGYGVTKDYTQAVSWLEKAAKQGLTVAQYNKQGICYENGLGVEKNGNKALFWFEEMLTKQEKSLSDKDKNALGKRIKALKEAGYSSSQEKVAETGKMTGWSTFLLQGKVEKVIYDDGRYLYFNTDGNVRKQNFREYVRGRVVGGATKKDYEYVYSSSTHFIIKQFTSYPNNKPIPLKIVCEDNTRKEITDDTEGTGWIFTYDTNNRMSNIIYYS